MVKQISEFCLEEEIFYSYVKFYLSDAQGFIPFSRDFDSGVRNTMTIDAINQLFEINVQVCIRETAASIQLVKVNKNFDKFGDPIYVIHNGFNHFDCLRLIQPDEESIREEIDMDMKTLRDPLVPKETQLLIFSNKSKKQKEKKKRKVIKTHKVIRK